MQNADKYRKGLILAALVAACAPALGIAEEPSPSRTADETSDVVLESRNTTMAEHRRAGEVYLIEVKKRNAGTYYLSDRDGQGQRESRSSDLENDVDSAKWSLFRW